MHKQSRIVASAILAMAFWALPLESHEIASENICCFTKRTPNLSYRYIAFRNIASNIGRCDGVYEIPTGRVFLSCYSRKFLIWLPCKQSGSKGTTLELKEPFRNPFDDEKLMLIAMDVKNVVEESVVLQSYESNGDWNLFFVADEKTWTVTIDFADLAPVYAKIVGSDFSQELFFEKSPFEKDFSVNLPAVDLVVDCNEAFVEGHRMAIKRRNDFDRRSIIRRGIESFKPRPYGDGPTESSHSNSRSADLIDRSLQDAFLFNF